MRRAFVLAAAALLLACGGGRPTAAPTAPTAAQAAQAPAPTAVPTATPTAAPTAAPAPTATPEGAGVGRPARLRIPAIGVDAAVEAVGLDPEGAMDVPKEPRNVAWYHHGPRPGQPGNAAIAGHVDYRDLGPVVFWRLTELRPGDEVLVVDDQGVERRFVVTGTETFPSDEFPVERIFGAAPGARLNLITCDRESTFNRDRREYKNNIVVFTEHRP